MTDVRCKMVLGGAAIGGDEDGHGTHEKGGNERGSFLSERVRERGREDGKAGWEDTRLAAAFFLDPWVLLVAVLGSIFCNQKPGPND